MVTQLRSYSHCPHVPRTVWVQNTKETKVLSVKILNFTAENTSEDTKMHKHFGSIILKVSCKEN